MTAIARSVFVLAIFVGASVMYAQSDPGPRGGPASAGNYFSSLNAMEQTVYSAAQAVFLEVDSVSGTLVGEAGKGLGPTFNGNSCAQCHAQPAVGGSSPGLTSRQNPIPNPQVALATLDGANNTVPSFITANGPVREARFVSDGGVHGLYTIRGRSDGGNCQLAQPDFATALASNNVIFRIPTPTFGLGLVEATPDSVLQANLADSQSTKNSMGISGKLNTSGNDGSVTRFGWKAQNKSLLVFAGEAYNVEQGVSNEVFPNERSAVSGCVMNPSPEDLSPINNPQAPHADVVSFALFMRLLAPPADKVNSNSEKNGQALFTSTGCALCHSPSLTTGPAQYTGMSNYTYHPYSDFALHAMGTVLADGISQGAAGPSEFRTAPLWGLGQRLFFLHDGRTTDLMEAIQAHSGCPNSATAAPTTSSNRGCGSEAFQVIDKFNALSNSQKQDLLNFLRAL